MLVDELSAWGIGYLASSVLAGVIAAVLAVYAWRNRSEPGAVPLSVIMAGATIWNAMVALQVLTEPVWLTAIWVRILYVAIAVGVGSWFAFGLEFTGREQYLTRRTALLLSVHPAAVALVVSVAPDAMATIGPGDGVTGIETTWGPVFAVHSLYSYGLLTLGLLLLLEYLIRAHSIYRWQGLAVLVGALGPFLGNVGYVLDVVPEDPSAISYVVTGLAFSWAIFSYKFMDLSPVARDQLVDELEDAMFVLDREDRFTDLNPAAERLLDVDSEAVIGEPAEAVLSAYPEVYERYRDVERTRDELEIQLGDQVRTFEIRISPLYDAHDRLVARQFLLHDNTHQRERQQRLEHQNEQLERFASVVSHDLRNPINVARGYVQMAKESNDPDPLQEVEQSLDRMEAIIEDVLTMAREGQKLDEPEPVDLAAVTRDAWEHVDTDDASLECPETMTVEADRDKLQRLLENLLRNALDHIENTPTITVGTIDPDDAAALLGSEEAAAVLDREEVGFYVADDGPGIPEAEREAVLDAGYTTAEDGTGLGLSIVQSIAESHGWTVDVADSEAGGARFELRGVVPVDGETETESDRTPPADSE